jgi:hypothetical protein
MHQVFLAPGLKTKHLGMIQTTSNSTCKYDSKEVIRSRAGMIWFDIHSTALAWALDCLKCLPKIRQESVFLTLNLCT